MKGSPSSSERALTSLRPDLPLRPAGPGPGPPSIDKFLTQLGNPGRFQIFVMLLLASNCIPVVVNHLLMAFYAVKTPHHCKVNWPEWIASLLYFWRRKILNFLQLNMRSFIFGLRPLLLQSLKQIYTSILQLGSKYWTFIIRKLIRASNTE